ncbi:MAG: class I SAM-dependent methyltransferase [Phormidesmis sp.]
MTKGAVAAAPAGAKRAEFRKRETCLLCESKNLEVIWVSSFGDRTVRQEIESAHYAGDPLAALQDIPFRRMQCQDCGMTFQGDILTEDWLKVLYGEWISSEQIEAVESALARSPLFVAQQNAKHCLRIAQMLGVEATPKRPPRILDFGCGDGSFLRSASLFGFDAVGIDFSDSRQQRNRRAGPVSLYSNLTDVQESLADGSLAGGERFDAITLFQVLEHVAEPLETLQALSNCIRPGGILVVEVPNCKGVGHRPESMEDHGKVDPLEHINHFTPSSLSLMCQRAGFAPVTYGAAFATTRLQEVLKALAGSLIRHSPLGPLRQNTNQYFRKGGR